MEWEHIPISESDLEDSIRKMIRITGTVNPITLSFEIPLFYVSRSAKEGLIIGGQGADELFAGYSKYVGLPEDSFRDLREADMARLFNETLVHESSRKRLLRSACPLPRRHAARPRTLRSIRRRSASPQTQSTEQNC